jgi:demethylmenaquinone methyltransferase/2-methoxy-6-polyprenyl-1,4-benzoquinol methylase
VTTQPLPPHPKLDRYYAEDAERLSFVNDMFDEGAQYYEWVCRVMSLGTGKQYRKQALRAAGLEPGMRVLDVATGTGLVLRSAADLSGTEGLSVGLDPSGGMLRECRKHCDGPAPRRRSAQAVR